MSHGKEVLDGLRDETAALRAMIPDVYDGFAQTHKAALRDGVLDVKTKELIAFAISVSKQCDGCIASHARGAARAGASPEEAAEAIGVALLMNGGPATVYGPRAFAAFSEFHGQFARLRTTSPS
ncbi:MAG: carboxymuconolactone decarboxylase family protein [Candidatus Phosphoribacter sp.]|nr:carboxymuconolactone decarboxylase family protein [Actinomycetales bacterium]